MCAESELVQCPIKTVHWPPHTFLQGSSLSHSHKYTNIVKMNYLLKVTEVIYKNVFALNKDKNLCWKRNSSKTSKKYILTPKYF